jgi:hypothetical protein
MRTNSTVAAAMMVACGHAQVGRCTTGSPPARPRVDRAWRQRLTLKCNEPLSSVAFDFNLRHCAKAMITGVAGKLSLDQAGDRV